MTHFEAGKGDAPRKQQDQKAYEKGWERIFRRRTNDEDYPEGKKREKEEPVKQHQEDDCND